MASYLTNEDVQNFDHELLDVAQRSALHAVAPELQRLQYENDEMRHRLMRADKRSIDQALDNAVPNWRTINSDPRFHAWLAERDVYSREVKQQLLNRAVANGDAARVIRFFEGYIAESSGAAPLGPSQYPLPAAGRKPTYTRQQIQQAAALRRKGAINDADWERWQHEMIAAGREGRILNPVKLDGSA